MPDLTLIGRYDQNILAGVTPSGTAPMSSYALTTFDRFDPATRIRYTTGNVTLTWTLGAPALGDVLIIPVTNLDPGLDSPAVLRLTNDQGLDVPIPVPAMLADGIPATIALDIEAAEPNSATRTASVWNLVITGNSANVIFGGAVAIYPKLILDDEPWFTDPAFGSAGIRIGFALRRQHAISEATNEYLTSFRQDYETRTRSLTATIRCHESAVPNIEAWFDANHGRALPGMLWPQGYIFDAYLGIWSPELTIQQVDDTLDIYDIGLSFDELSKGKPVA